MSNVNLSWIDHTVIELEKEVKAGLLKQTEEKMVEDYRNQIRPLIRESLEKVTFEKVELMKNMLSMRNDLNVQIRIKE